MFIVHIWSQQVYELIAWLRPANQNGRNPIYLVQFLIVVSINGPYDLTVIILAILGVISNRAICLRETAQI